jgi:hypothetical protein
MKLPLTRSESIEMTTHLRLSHLCLLLQVRLGGYIVNSCDFYSYTFIGKLTVFLQVQEFRLFKPTVTSSTYDTRLSLHSSKTGLVCLSLSLHLYVLTSIYNIDGMTITSKSHTHPSHSQTSRLLTSSLSLGVPVPQATQCMEYTSHKHHFFV